MLAMLSRFKKKKVPNYPTKREFEKLEEMVDGHHIRLNNIFVYHELELTPYMKLMREVSYELLKFFDNVCSKYGLEYWLDFGTLLGAVRHGGFIPWDDDLDVGMLRADYYKFLEAFPKELERFDLKYIEAWFKEPSWDINSRRWYQINCKYPEYNGKFVGLDVFPYDFITEYDDDYIPAFHNVVRPAFFKVWKGDVPLKEALDATCGRLNLSLTKTDYFIGGVDGGRFYFTSPFKILKTKDLLPLKRIKFGNYEFSAPNSPENYISEIYGKDFMKIGKTSKDHGRLNRYKKHENIMELLGEAKEELLSANRTFE